MKALNKTSLVLLTALAAIVGIAYAAQPPNVVASDPNGNTAMGTSSLFNLTNGINNTATGFMVLFRNTSGSDNTATGRNSLQNNTTGSKNTATGFLALVNNKSGSDNTATGNKSLVGNVTGSNNTATGSESLMDNSGNNNTATGYFSLRSNGSGHDNTAAGFESLRNNTTGSSNTATGGVALYNNSVGNANTATGFGALLNNTSGVYNTGSGTNALAHNTVGNYNTASGSDALLGNTTGLYNTAGGVRALQNNATGFRNVALGYQAGLRVTGSDNITIGGDNQGNVAVNGVIRIGISVYQKKTYIAGIRGVTTGLATAIPVLIDANGQLGTIQSSGRYKEDIRPMGSVSERLFALRPVTFRYKQPSDDGSKPVQFGLIAEEVAEAFPELVVYDDQGKPETVSYHLLATLLLNEFQKQQSLTQAQATRIASLEERSVELAQLKKQVAMMAEVIERLDHERMVATNR